MTSLTFIAAVTGAVLAWVWRRFSNPQRIIEAKRQARARLYAMRLYADDPALTFRAQRQLLLWTARYLAQMLRPTAVAIVPLLVLFVQLDNVYGRRLLAPGESAMVTAQFGRGTDVRTLGTTLEGRGVMIETPAVRIPDRRQICWRVRADYSLNPAPTRSVRLRVGGTAISKTVRCGHEAPNLWAVFRDGSPSIEVSCAAATDVSVDVFGFHIGWPVWFLLVSGLTMLVLRTA